MSKLMSPTADNLFVERVERLTHALDFALHARQLAVLIVSFKSRIVLEQVQGALSAHLSEIGQNIETIWVNAERDWDIAHSLSMRPQQSHTIYFVQGLQFGGASAFRALNIRREYLRDFALRTVFWVTETELQMIMDQAPDFWAFRTASVSFPEIPSDSELIPDTFDPRDYVWLDLDLASLSPTLGESIAWREKIFEIESDSSQAQVFEYQRAYTLAALYWLAQDYGRADAYILRAKEIARSLQDLEREFATLVGEGNIICANVLADQAERATAIIEIAKLLKPHHEATRLLQGNLYRLQGEFRAAEKTYLDGLALFQHDRAEEAEARRNPVWQSIQTGLAKTYMAQGRDEDARARVLDVLQSNPQHHLAQELYTKANHNLGQGLQDDQTYINVNAASAAIPQPLQLQLV